MWVLWNNYLWPCLSLESVLTVCDLSKLLSIHKMESERVQQQLFSLKFLRVYSYYTHQCCSVVNLVHSRSWWQSLAKIIRWIQSEHGLFVTWTTAPCCNNSLKISIELLHLVGHLLSFLLADLIADKLNKPYNTIIRLIRCKLYFSLLHSTITCLRGSRHPKSNFSYLFITDPALVVVKGRSLTESFSFVFLSPELSSHLHLNYFALFIMYHLKLDSV